MNTIDTMVKAATLKLRIQIAGDVEAARCELDLPMSISALYSAMAMQVELERLSRAEAAQDADL